MRCVDHLQKQWQDLKKGFVNPLESSQNSKFVKHIEDMLALNNIMDSVLKASDVVLDCWKLNNLMFIF